MAPHADLNLSSLDQISDDWHAQSWRSKEIHVQKVEYRDQGKLERVQNNLDSLPPLVCSADIEEARECYAEAARGERFIIQGGDCAESFEDVQLDIIKAKTSLLAEQASLIENNLMLPVTCVGRIAGQYAKPRSQPMEKLPDGRTVHAFRGHNINGVGVDQRSPDPQRLLHGYFHSAAILNTISVINTQTSAMNSQAASGIASPVPETNETSSSDSESAAAASDGTSRSRDRKSSTDASSRSSVNAHEADIFTSHEALLLPYESFLTRGRYCTSAAFLWVGERTRQLDGAHIEFLRGLRNPIGMKISGNIAPDELVACLDRLCPLKGADPGRVTLITRCGAGKVAGVLPRLIRAVQESGHRPVWMCDPCHGNTVTATEEKIKTRCTITMLDEITQTYATHAANGSRLDGLHIEQTGEDVVECVEHTAVGKADLSLGANYRTLCDPRLSREQALVLVERFVDFVRNFEVERKLREMVERGGEVENVVGAAEKVGVTVSQRPVEIVG